jgi:hypothetical protein
MLIMGLVLSVTMNIGYYDRIYLSDSLPPPSYPARHLLCPQRDRGQAYLDLVHLTEVC